MHRDRRPLRLAACWAGLGMRHAAQEACGDRPPPGRIDAEPTETRRRQMNPRGFLQPMIALAAAAFGIVAALAWNAAIQATIQQFMGPAQSLTGLYIYAVLATILAVVVLVALGRAAARVGGESTIKG